MEKKSKAKYRKMYGIFCLLFGDNHELPDNSEREREIIKRPHTARSFVRRRCNELTENVTMR